MAKVQFIEGNGAYESFQIYSHDPYLRNNLTNKQAIQPMYDTMPAHTGKSLQEWFEKRYKGLRKTLEG